MYFETHKAVAGDWTKWYAWNEDITEKHAGMALELIKQFCIAYRKAVDSLNDEYYRLKGDSETDYFNRRKEVSGKCAKVCADLEARLTQTLASLDKKNATVTENINSLDKRERDNAAVVGVKDYAELADTRKRLLKAFKKEQEAVRALAKEVCAEKRAAAERERDIQLDSMEKEYREKLAQIERDHDAAVERVENGYTDLFRNTCFPLDTIRQYIEKAESYNYPFKDYTHRKTNGEYIYIGRMALRIDKKYTTPLVMRLINEFMDVRSDGLDGEVEISLPYCQRISDGVGLFVTEKKVENPDANKRENFYYKIPMLMLRVFMGLEAGNVEAFTIDGESMGRYFQELVALGGESRRIIESASTQEDTIAQKLATLRSKMDGITNNYGNDFESRMLHESYYVLAIANFPANFSKRALTDLNMIVRNAKQVGAAVFIFADENRIKDLTGEEKIIVDEIMGALHNAEYCDGRISCKEAYTSDEFELDLTSMHSVSDADIDSVISALGRGIKEYKPHAITFDEINPGLSDENTWMARTTENGLSIPIGKKGASEIVDLVIGGGGATDKHHVLIEGNTGTGKSTFLHTLIMSTLINYNQQDVEICLLDFKGTVEFKIYADHYVPALKIVSVDCGREFGLQVLEAVLEENTIREDKFREVNASGTFDYKTKTGRSMPKVLLIIDEYQQLLCSDDAITKRCEEILKRLTQEGRSQGIHVILATQNIASAKLDSSVYTQMAVRIALKGSTRVLDSDNDGKLQLDNGRGGTTIYNDNRGEKTANKLFYTARIGDTDFQHGLLEKIGALQESIEVRVESELPNKILYMNIEDNVRHVLNKFINEKAAPVPLDAKMPGVYGLYLGDAYEIKGKFNIGLIDRAGSNMLFAVPKQQGAKLLANSVISALYSDAANAMAEKGNRLVHFVNMAGADIGEAIEKLERHFPKQIKYATPNNVESDWAVSESKYENVKEIIDNTYDELQKRIKDKKNGTYNPNDRIVFILAGMERVGALARLNAYDSPAGFGFGAVENSEKNSVEKITDIINFGAEYGINCIMYTADFDGATAIFGNLFYEKFALRIAQGMSNAAMRELVMEVHPESLTGNTLAFYNRFNESNKKIRAFDIPRDEWLARFAERYREFEGGR